MAKVYNYKTTPNQKVVKVKKEKCDKQNTYATINLDALSKAMAELDAGAFKMWVYFSKNQDGYTFALSSRECKDNFGMGRTQYDRGIKVLIEKGYLVNIKGNTYEFNEIPVVLNQYNGDSKNNSVVLNQYNDVVLNQNNDVVLNQYNALYQNDTRNNTDTTINTTEDNDCVSLQTTFEVSRRCLSSSEDEGTEPEVEEVKEVKIEDIQVDGEISKTDLQMVLKYEMIGENLVRFSTGKIFRVV